MTPEMFGKPKGEASRSLRDEEIVFVEKCNWIDSDIENPSDHWRGKYGNLIDVKDLFQQEYIVTGRLMNKDPEDDDEVFVATWNYKDSTWRYTKDTSVKYGTKKSGWNIIAWQKFPEAFIKK